MSTRYICGLLVVGMLFGCQSQSVQKQQSTEPVLAESEAKPVTAVQPAEASPEEKPTLVEKPAAEVAQEATPTPVVPEKNKQDPIVLKLIRLGQEALMAQRLLTPEEDNANLYFQAALGREPDNRAAIDGLASIVETYTGWAWQKALSGQYVQAENLLDKAAFVNSKDPLIAETKQRIQARIAARSQRKPVVVKAVNPDQYFLAKNLFSMQEEEIIRQIQPVIDRIQRDQLKIAIYWPNDKEARLLYQIINSRVEDFRVRGMIYHRADHMIEVKQP